MRTPDKREAPAALRQAETRAILTVQLDEKFAATTTPTQARKPSRRRKSKRQHLDAAWRALLRQLRHLLCRAVKRYALTGTAAALAEVNTALAVLLAEERDAATRRKEARR